MHSPNCGVGGNLGTTKADTLSSVGCRRGTLAATSSPRRRGWHRPHLLDPQFFALAAKRSVHRPLRVKLMRGYRVALIRFLRLVGDTVGRRHKRGSREDGALGRLTQLGRLTHDDWLLEITIANLATRTRTVFWVVDVHD